MREELVKLVSDNQYAGETAEITVEAVDRGFDASSETFPAHRRYVSIEEDFPYDDDEFRSKHIAFHTREAYVEFIDNLLEAGAAAFDYDPRVEFAENLIAQTKEQVFEAELDAIEAPPTTVINNFCGEEMPQEIRDALTVLFENERAEQEAREAGYLPLWLGPKRRAKLLELLDAESATILGVDENGEPTYEDWRPPAPTQEQDDLATDLYADDFEPYEPPTITDGVTEWPAENAEVAGVPGEAEYTLTITIPSVQFENPLDPDTRDDPLG